MFELEFAPVRRRQPSGLTRLGVRSDGGSAIGPGGEGGVILTDFSFLEPDNFSSSQGRRATRISSVELIGGVNDISSVVVGLAGSAGAGLGDFKINCCACPSAEIVAETIASTTIAVRRNRSGNAMGQ